MDEEAAAHEDPMHFGDERVHPPHREVIAARAVSPVDAFFHVVAHGRFPKAPVRCVDRELARLGRDAHVGVGERIGADLAIEREAVHPRTEGDHHHRHRAVERISGCDLLRARLQKMLGPRLRDALRHPQHRKNRPDRHVHVEIVGPVERIEREQIPSPHRLRRKVMGHVVGIGEGRRQLTAPLALAPHDFDRHIVQRFARGRVRAARDGRCDEFAGRLNVV